MTARQEKLVRGSYDRLALGFVGLCVAGLYSAVAFSPVKPATYTVELDAALEGETGRLASAEVYSLALPPEVEAKAREVEGVRDVKLDLVWEPPWDMEMMSPAARLQLNV